MSDFTGLHNTAKEELAEALVSLDNAISTMVRLRRYKTHKDADFIVLMKQRLSHVRLHLSHFDTCLVQIEQAADELEKLRQ